MTDQLELAQTALRDVAQVTLRARAKVRGFHFPEDAARELLVDLEAVLSGFIAAGGVIVLGEGAQRIASTPRIELPDAIGEAATRRPLT